jgi:23S rRNA pseudouridine1911/1915/1917 synthase
MDRHDASAREAGTNDGYTYREQIGPRDAGQTVLAHLAERHTHSSAITWAARVAAGEVHLGARVAGAEEILRAGDTVAWHRPPWIEPPVPLAFAVLYRDDHLLAVAKPAGLPSIPAGGFLVHTLLHLVRQRYPDANPLHRLGRGTSGLVLCSRSTEARRAVSRQWRAGTLTKTYRALATGLPGRRSFSVEMPIGPVPHARLGQVHAARLDGGGRPALSHVRVIAEREGNAIVEVEIPTGRPHQIRIHLAAAGHPLVGDPLYAAGGLPLPDAALPGETGYLLHAHRLRLTHPTSGSLLELECMPPPPLRVD